MSAIKQIRGQIRQVVKDLLPEVLKAEIYAAIQKENDERLIRIEKHLRETLNKIEDRSKDVLGYLMRQTAQGAPTQVVDKKGE